MERERDAELSRIAQTYFDGDRAAAAEFIKEAEAANDEINKLFADNVPGNEPRTQAEFNETWRRIFERRIRSNKVLAETLANPTRREFQARNPLETMPKHAALLENYRGFGSGFFISPDGWLITNLHVIGNSEQVDVRPSDQQVIEAKVVARDPENDLALLKAEVKSPAFLPVSESSRELELGHSVFTIGFPNPVVQGLEPKFTDGRVSSRAGIRDNESFYQISVPVQPGNSGGPLIDIESGWAVGVITLRLDHTSDGRAAENVSYAVKGSLLHRFASATPEVAASMRSAAAEKPSDAAAIIARAKGSAVTVLVPN